MWENRICHHIIFRLKEPNASYDININFDFFFWGGVKMSLLLWPAFRHCIWWPPHEPNTCETFWSLVINSAQFLRSQWRKMPNSQRNVSEVHAALKTNFGYLTWRKLTRDAKYPNIQQHCQVKIHALRTIYRWDICMSPSDGFVISVDLEWNCTLGGSMRPLYLGGQQHYVTMHKMAQVPLLAPFYCICFSQRVNCF